MASKNTEAHWEKTKGLMRITLALWFFFGYVVFMFGHDINSMSFLGYPLAYYMTAQGSLAAFVIIIFWSTGKQQEIDEEHGVSDEGRND
jgi:putative solute:sodium symporter small subunit